MIEIKYLKYNVELIALITVQYIYPGKVLVRVKLRECDQ